VRAAFDDIMRFWYDRGVAGFRIDVCNVIIKDAELRDNPPATEDDDFEAQMFGQRSVYNANRPEVHDVIRRWRAGRHLRRAPGAHRRDAGAGRRPGPVLRQRETTSCTWPSTSISSARPSRLRRMRAVVEETEAPSRRAPGRRGRAPTTTCSAFATRWAGDDPTQGAGRAPHAAVPPGTPVLYQGDEIGLDANSRGLAGPLGVVAYTRTCGTPSACVAPITSRTTIRPGARCAARTPMQWSWTRPRGGGVHRRSS
jgi:alpha-glucosidase